jgi:hypothetical protein
MAPYLLNLPCRAQLTGNPQLPTINYPHRQVFLRSSVGLESRYTASGWTQIKQCFKQFPYRCCGRLPSDSPGIVDVFIGRYQAKAAIHSVTSHQRVYTSQYKMSIFFVRFKSTWNVVADYFLVQSAVTNFMNVTSVVLYAPRRTGEWSGFNGHSTGLRTLQTGK